MSSYLSLAAKRGFDSETWLQRAIVACGVIFLLLALLFPLFTMLVKSLENRAGDFIGLSNFAAYFSNPALTESILNSLNIATWTTVIVVSTAFVFAYALTHSGMVGKKGFRLLTLLPLFAPSLLPALSMIYLFGNQGILRDWLPADTIYGPVGIIMGLSFWAFPHALMILITAFSNSDARLYEAARSMNTPRWRVFLTVTLPSVRYGLINTVFVIFTLTITDFGVAKVIGGQYNVLATDIYKQVVGQQNFQMGAVVSVILLLPALVSFMVERRVQRHQSSQLSARLCPCSRTGRPCGICY